jgi:hypothetical protein
MNAMLHYQIQILQQNCIAVNESYAALSYSDLATKLHRSK